MACRGHKTCGTQGPLVTQAMGPGTGRAAPLGSGDTQVQPCSPESCELNLLMVTGHQLGDEGQVGDLCGCPAELEDDDEGEVVDEGCPLRRVLLATQAGVEDEGEGHKDTGGAWEESGVVRGCTACFPATPTVPASSDRDEQTQSALC